MKTGQRLLLSLEVIEYQMKQTLSFATESRTLGMHWSCTGIEASEIQFAIRLSFISTTCKNKLNELFWLPKNTVN